MTPYYADELCTLMLGDCVEVMAGMQPESVDAIVTDPPYDLTSGKKGGSGLASVNLDSPYGRARIGTGNGSGGFMGKAWDGTGVAFDPATWREAFRVAKPGAHLLAAGGTRTFHRLVCALEDAGWEIRDTLMHVYASGFPKSHNLPGGLGTALKPAFEPWTLARKPLRGTVAANVTAFGTGALNIDATRIYAAPGDKAEFPVGAESPDGTIVTGLHSRPRGNDRDPLGRWPANLILTDPIFDGGVEGVVGGGETTALPEKGYHPGPWTERAAFPLGPGDTAYHDAGTYSRFFLVPKAARSDREPRGLPERENADWPQSLDGNDARGARARANVHPTVKPIELMRHLVRLVTPPGGVILDCFLGSGTTAIAANQEGFRCIGIEREQEYLDIAVARLAHQPLGMAL